VYGMLARSFLVEGMGLGEQSCMEMRFYVWIAVEIETSLRELPWVKG